MRIETHYDPKPIPMRDCDWTAIDADTYDGAPDCRCPIGHGATEADAIDDLMEQMQ